MNAPAMSLRVDGFALEPTTEDGRVWSYVPAGAFVEHGDAGPLFSIIEAGSTAFLQCTARVGIDENRRRRLLTRLQELWPAAEAIEPAPIAVERIALEARSDDEWVAIAESSGSNMPPWRAALAAPLTPAQLAACKAAAAGEPGHVRLRARITRTTNAGRSITAEAARSASVEASGHTSAFSYSTTTTHSTTGAAAGHIELTSDIADQLSPHGGARP
jgi:hypothetical protein